MQPNINNNVMFIMPWGSNHASNLLLSMPQNFGYGSVLSVESLYPFLSSLHSHHPTLALWVFSNTAAKIASHPLLSLHYFFSRSIDLNRETTVYSMCQNTTLFTKREPISANFLCSRGYLEKSSNMFDTRWTSPIILWNTASKTLGRK